MAAQAWLMIRGVLEARTKDKCGLDGVPLDQELLSILLVTAEPTTKLSLDLSFWHQINSDWKNLFSAGSLYIETGYGGNPAIDYWFQVFWNLKQKTNDGKGLEEEPGFGCVYFTWRIRVMLSFRRQVASWQPDLFKNTRLSCSAESNEALETNEELIPIAWWNRPLAWGEIIKAHTDVPPCKRIGNGNISQLTTPVNAYNARCHTRWSWFVRTCS